VGTPRRNKEADRDTGAFAVAIVAEAVEAAEAAPPTGTGERKYIKHCCSTSLLGLGSTKSAKASCPAGRACPCSRAHSLARAKPAGVARVFLLRGLAAPLPAPPIPISANDAVEDPPPAMSGAVRARCDAEAEGGAREEPAVGGGEGDSDGVGDAKLPTPAAPPTSAGDTNRGEYSTGAAGSNDIAVAAPLRPAAAAPRPWKRAWAEPLPPDAWVTWNGEKGSRCNGVLTEEEEDEDSGGAPAGGRGWNEGGDIGRGSGCEHEGVKEAADCSFASLLLASKCSNCACTPPMSLSPPGEVMSQNTCDALMGEGENELYADDASNGGEDQPLPGVACIVMALSGVRGEADAGARG